LAMMKRSPRRHDGEEDLVRLCKNGKCHGPPGRVSSVMLEFC
jgi:hypothetical protein